MRRLCGLEDTRNLLSSANFQQKALKISENDENYCSVTEEGKRQPEK